MSIQERYLIIEEERKEREAQERKRRDEEWQKRVEESRRWLAECAARRKITIQLTPEEKERSLKMYE